MSIRDHRQAQPKTRSYIAQAAHMRRAEKDMGNKTQAGRTRKDQRSRSIVRHELRTARFD